MTRQEYFDKAVAGIASQGFKRGLGKIGFCAYRGLNGSRCIAAGTECVKRL